MGLSLLIASSKEARPAETHDGVGREVAGFFDRRQGILYLVPRTTIPTDQIVQCM
jgi:hypothetical protein